MTPCISQVTVLPSSFEADVRACAKVGCPALEVWLTKLENYVSSHSAVAARELVSEQGIQLAAAAAQGGLLLTEGDARRESLSLFERRLDLCQSLGIPVLIVVADLASGMDSSDYERAVGAFKDAARLAAQRNVRLALEFQGRSDFCNNLNTALAIVAHADEPNGGVCLDVFQYYIGPSKFEDLAGLSPSNLFHVQLSDLAGIPRERAADSDRVLPGDGDFSLKPIIGHLRSMGYSAAVSIELMNPLIWQLPAAQVFEIGLTAARKALNLSGT